MGLLGWSWSGTLRLQHPTELRAPLSQETPERRERGTAVLSTKAGLLSPALRCSWSLEGTCVLFLLLKPLSKWSYGR